MSPNNQPIFTDEEVFTVHLWGLLEGYSYVSETHRHGSRYLSNYFPKLPSYKAFNNRLNNLAGLLPHLAESLQMLLLPRLHRPSFIGLLDSMPIVLAKGTRRYNAKVAPEIATSGTCAARGMDYYGVKLHLIGEREIGGLPKPLYIEATPASEHDSQLLKRLQYTLCDNLFGDRAYVGEESFKRLKDEVKTTLVTPVKKVRNGPELNTRDRWYSRAVSSIRQPIESLFNWMQQKTNIQDASKVRSTKGLNVHIWAKIAITLSIMLF